MTDTVNVVPGGGLDRFGMVASCVCAAHCAVMPSVVGLLPLFGLNVIADEQVEWALIGIAVLVGMASLLPAYFRHHRRATPLVIFTAGLGLIFVGRSLFEEGGAGETASVVLGALTFAAAHFLISDCAGDVACRKRVSRCGKPRRSQPFIRRYQPFIAFAQRLIENRFSSLTAFRKLSAFQKLTI